MCIRDRYTPDEERRKQITALLFKYKQGLSYTELQTLMKDKFGIDVYKRQALQKRKHAAN